MYLLRSFQKTLPYICKVWNSDNGSCYLRYFCVKVVALYGSEVKKLSWVKKNLLLDHISLWCLMMITLNFSPCCPFLSLQEQAALEEAASSQTEKSQICPNSNYRDKYSHLIGTSAAKDAAHTLEANRAYGCGECRGRLTEMKHFALCHSLWSLCWLFSVPVPVANKRDTRSIEEAMNAIRAKKRQKREDDTGAHGSSSWVSGTIAVCLSAVCVCVCEHVSAFMCVSFIL